jgi:hypothetical protein
MGREGERERDKKRRGGRAAVHASTWSFMSQKL